MDFIYIGNHMLTNSEETRVFAALADDTRRQILQALAARPLAVHEVAAGFDVTRPAVSRHLRILKDANLVGLEPAGRTNLYYVKTSTLREVEDWLNTFWARRLSKLKTLVEETTVDH